LENKKYIAFIGDSFTWGQGLYLPSWIDRKPNLLSQISNKDLQWKDQENFIDNEDLRIKDELSFTGIVSKELGRGCVKKIENGGSNLGNLVVISSDNMLNVDGEPIPHFSFNGKDMILIFQLTNFGRDEIIIHMTDEEREEILKIDSADAIPTITKLFKNRVKNYFEHIDNTLQRLSIENGFEYWYLDWLGDYYDFLPDKFIDIKIGNNSGKHFAPLVDNFPIIVKFDNKELRDGHLNKVANEMIAESILEWLRDKSRGVGG
jgi:lysophospholipase L1-like esterase